MGAVWPWMLCGVTGPAPDLVAGRPVNVRRSQASSYGHLCILFSTLCSNLWI